MFKVIIKESEPQSFSFPPLFLIRVGRFFINWSSLAVYPKPVLQGLSFTAVFLWKVVFPPWYFIGLGDFSLTSLSHSPTFWIEFWITCILLGCGAVLALRDIARRFLFLTLQSVGFLPQFSTGLRGFLSMAVYQIITLINNFSSSVLSELRGFFINNTFDSILSSS